VLESLITGYYNIHVICNCAESVINKFKNQYRPKNFFAKMSPEKLKTDTRETRANKYWYTYLRIYSNAYSGFVNLLQGSQTQRELRAA